MSLTKDDVFALACALATVSGHSDIEGYAQAVSDHFCTEETRLAIGVDIAQSLAPAPAAPAPAAE